jgi:hypothetical protein
VAKRLITETDVRAMARGAQIVLDRETIATPAALDAAFQRGISVRYAGVALQQGRVQLDADIATGKLWQRILAQEGTYVVQVSGGHATVSRLAEQGPVLFGSE